MPAMREAGAAIMQVKSAGVTAEYKSDASPVTAADHASEAILKAALETHFPNIPVISEEHADSHLLRPSDFYFLVDPLDGTREFLREDSNGNFTVNIGFVQGVWPVAGSFMSRLWIGFAGQIQLLKRIRNAAA